MFSAQYGGARQSVTTSVITAILVTLVSYGAWMALPPLPDSAKSSETVFWAASTESEPGISPLFPAATFAVIAALSIIVALDSFLAQHVLIPHVRADLERLTSRLGVSTITVSSVDASAVWGCVNLHGITVTNPTDFGAGVLLRVDGLCCQIRRPWSLLVRRWRCQGDEVDISVLSLTDIDVVLQVQGTLATGFGSSNVGEALLQLKSLTSDNDSSRYRVEKVELVRVHLQCSLGARMDVRVPLGDFSCSPTGLDANERLDMLLRAVLRGAATSLAASLGEAFSGLCSSMERALSTTGWTWKLAAGGNAESAGPDLSESQPEEYADGIPHAQEIIPWNVDGLAEWQYVTEPIASCHEILPPDCARPALDDDNDGCHQPEPRERCWSSSWSDASTSESISDLTPSENVNSLKALLSPVLPSVVPNFPWKVQDLVEWYGTSDECPPSGPSVIGSLESGRTLGKAASVLVKAQEWLTRELPEENGATCANLFSEQW